jgi:hypothetical protein
MYRNGAAIGIVSAIMPVVPVETPVDPAAAALVLFVAARGSTLPRIAVWLIDTPAAPAIATISSAFALSCSRVYLGYSNLFYQAKKILVQR